MCVREQGGWQRGRKVGTAGSWNGTHTHLSVKFTIYMGKFHGAPKQLQWKHQRCLENTLLLTVLNMHVCFSSWIIENANRMTLVICKWQLKKAFPSPTSSKEFCSPWQKEAWVEPLIRSCMWRIPSSYPIHSAWSWPSFWSHGGYQKNSLFTYSNKVEQEWILVYSNTYDKWGH